MTTTPHTKTTLTITKNWQRKKREENERQDTQM
jgi:hypothetical protein